MQFLEIGKIVKAHGLNGRVKVLSFMQSHDLLKSLKEVFIKRGKDAPALFSLKSFQIKGNCFYLEMEGIGSIDQAKGLVGCQALIPARKLPPLPEDEYYWEELIGLEVVTEERRFLGKVERIFPTGSNDVYVCSGGEKEILLPAIADVVRKIDLEKGIMVVRLLEGM
ncbi:MAG: ribosome maturation factor RimM [Syntrophales bacterium]|nr:ribosome maturation factor RimM [Syntrophales bacterium]